LIHSSVADSATVINEFLNELARQRTLDDMFSAVQRATSALFAEARAARGTFEGSSGLALAALFGVFHRRLSLTCVRLTFEALGTLFGNFQRFIEVDFDLVQQRFIADNAAVQVPERATDLATMVRQLTRAECERVVHEELAALETSIGGESPSAIATRLRLLRQRAPALGKLHYVAFVDHLAHACYSEARTALHRYFDSFVAYVALGSDDGTHEIATTPPQSTLPTPAAMHAQQQLVQRRGGMLVHAALSLARLHHAFGDARAAHHALVEAMRVAQERNDARR
jgi:hypothetical protein